MHSLLESGAFLIPANGTQAREAKHIIGGRCNLAGAHSPNSGKPLLQYAALYVATGETACREWKYPYISLLYSWTCAICESPFSYRQGKDVIEIIQAKQGKGYDDFPYPNYPESFPEVPSVLMPLTDSERSVIAALNAGAESIDVVGDLDIPRHQVGGTPYWLQKHAEPACPLCEQQMKFLATMGNNTYRDPEGFVGNEFVQVVFDVCCGCNVICAENYAD